MNLSPTPLISVVVCCSRPARFAVRVLDSLAAQVLLHTLFEVIVVDNTPNPARLRRSVLRYQDRIAVTLTWVGRAGLSRARNASLSVTRGRYVAFLDDDAVADGQWLGAVVGAFQRGPDRLVCVGGRVLPLRDYHRPSWLPASAEGALSIVRSEQGAEDVGPEHLIIGTNIAFRREVLLAAGGFRTCLGRKAKTLLSNEENDLRGRLASLGYRTDYDPRALVFHEVHADRLTRRWFYRRAFWQGVSERARGGSRWSLLLLRLIAECMCVAGWGATAPDRLVGPRPQQATFSVVSAALLRIGRGAGRFLLQRAGDWTQHADASPDVQLL